MAIGVIGGTICFFVTNFIKQRLKIDDSLDVFAVQASANVLGSHFASLIFATLLIRLLSRAPPSRGPPRRRSRRDEEEYEFSSLPASSSSAAPAAKSAFESAQDFKKGAY